MSEKELFLTAVLVWLSIEDLRKKKIIIWPLIPVFLWEVIDLLQQDDMVFGEHLWGAMVGLVFCVIAIVTKEVIGLGDGIVIGLLGFYIGVRNICICLCIAFFVAGLAAVVLCGIHKFGKKARLPFVPFLCLGYLLEM